MNVARQRLAVGTGHITVRAQQARAELDEKSDVIPLGIIMNNEVNVCS